MTPRIILVGTTHPGNIGATARAMKTMDLHDLVLVAPQAVFPHPQAQAMAAGADDVLAAARVCATLEEALADCALVYGASARQRTIPWPMLDPRGCAQEVAVAEGQVALVFGREHSGLTNAELERCHTLVHIPANPAFSSLNLAQAVQILAYEIYLARHAAPRPARPDNKLGERLAPLAETTLFFDHLEQTLVDIDFLDPARPRHLMRRLKRLFNRTQLTQNEVNILRGILTAVQKHRN